MSMITVDSDLRATSKLCILIIYCLLTKHETGCNTSQKKDGHYGGRKFVTERGTTPKSLASNSDMRFWVSLQQADKLFCALSFLLLKRK